MGRKEALKLGEGNLPGAVKVGDEDGGFRRRFRGANTHVCICRASFRCHVAAFCMLLQGEAGLSLIANGRDFNRIPENGEGNF